MSQNSQKVYDDFNAEKVEATVRIDSTTSTQDHEQVCCPGNSSSKFGDESTLFYNSYVAQKTFAQGLVIGALLATNASQLKLLLADEFSQSRDSKWMIPLVLVCFSIVAQLFTLVLLGVLVNFQLTDRAKRTRLNVLNKLILALSAITCIVNIVSSVFIHIDMAVLVNKVTGSAAFWSTQSLDSVPARFF